MPDELLERLRRFHDQTFPGIQDQFQDLVERGQHPTILFIGCSDSRLVHSRFGLHVVDVQQREAGADQPFESVHGAVAMTLRQQTYVTALRQYLALLAGQAELEGVELDAADTPLVQ